MCGFSGIFSPYVTDSIKIQNSLFAIKHRGPDDQVIVGFSDAATPFYLATDLSSVDTKQKHNFGSQKNASFNWLGFTRLSIVDESSNGMQPFYDAPSKTIFMMVGEIYNYSEIKQTYFSDHSIFVSQSDTEVAFRLYLLLGNDFVAQLQGMFSIVIYKISENKIYAWRDPTGQKPFFYSIYDNTFNFCSEIKGILAAQPQLNEIETKSVAYNMYLGTCPAPLTLYKNIYSLEPGHILEVNLSDFKNHSYAYWHWKYTSKNEILPYAQFDELLNTTIQKHQTGFPKKTLALSGGIDSSLLACYLSKYDKNIVAITLGDFQDKNNEINAAKLSAAWAKIHIEISNFDDYDLNTLIRYEDEPNSMPESAYFVAQKAQKLQSKVIFSGLGLDEIFGGYEYYSELSAYKSINKISFLASKIPFIGSKANKLLDLHQFGILALPFIKKSMYDWQQIKLCFGQESHDWQHPLEYILNKINKNITDFTYFPVLKQYSMLDIYYYISSHHALRNDQASMRFSQEMRSPFIDSHFIQTLFHYDSIFEGINKKTKPYLRHFASKIIAPSLENLPKKGFNSNFMLQNNQEIKKLAIHSTFIPLLNEKTRWNLASISLLLNK